jgi:hypothetical protein
MTASELAKTVIEAIKADTADDAFAEKTATDFAALEPLAMYHFVIQVAGGLRESATDKQGLNAFNLKLAKHEAFVEAMARLNTAKEAGQFAKP